MHSHKETLIIGGAYLFLALLVFGSSISFGFSIIDDALLVSKNMFIQGPTLRNLLHAFTTFDPELYIPFTLISYQLNYLIGGAHPAIYHFTNILLHTGSAVLVTLIARRFVSASFFAYAAGLAFLLHPLNTEAVVWISGRKDTLSTLFALLSAYFFLKESDESWHRTSLLFFFFALLTKASVMTLPLFFAFLLILHRQNFCELVKRVTPFILLSTVFGVIALFGKQRIVSDTSLIETLLMACKSAVFYFEKLIVPIGLNPFYPYHDPITISSPDFFIPVMILVTLFVGCIALRRWFKWPLRVLVIYLLVLSPSFLNAHKGLTWFFAVDRYTYFPFVILFILLASAFDELTRYAWRQKVIIQGGMVLLLSTYAALSFAQTQTWRSDETMLRRSLELYPDNVPARTAFAALYRSVGDLESEEAVLKQGQSYRAHIAYSLGLGSIEAARGNLDAAQTHYTEAEAMDPLNPDVYFHQGALAESEGATDFARIQYKKAVELDPSFVGSMVNLGAIESDEGKYEEALAWYERALVWGMNSQQLQYNVGLVLERLDRKDEALRHFRDAYALSPQNTDIVTTYAYRLYERGDAIEARHILEEYLDYDPENRSARRLMELLETR
ncbi:MAG: tetratricopeptide repeat protein [Candidatus Peribacteraceae bacterium]